MTSYVRQHYELAKTGTPSQETDEKVGPEPPPTNWDEGAGGAGNPPHSTEKEAD